MVGIVIGLLVVAVAMGALMVSRNVSGTVSDASGIQQQAAYAIRTIGQQLRQAGSLYLNLDPNNTSVTDSTLAASTPVAFETKTDNFDPTTNTLLGEINNSSTTLTVGYRRYKEDVFGSSDAQSLVRNCLGGPKDDSTDQIVKSVFTFTSGDSTLRCNGNDTTDQPILQNVADFQVRYLQQSDGAAGDTKIRYVTADTLGDATRGNWSKVQAVEICMVLYGDEVIDIPAGSQYVGCSGQKIDFPTTGTAARRMHLTFRNVFQLRSQG